MQRQQRGTQAAWVEGSILNRPPPPMAPPVSSSVKEAVGTVEATSQGPHLHHDTPGSCSCQAAPSPDSSPRGRAPPVWATWQRPNVLLLS